MRRRSPRRTIRRPCRAPGCPAPAARPGAGRPRAAGAAGECLCDLATSGSTGVPKGVEVSHAAAINTIDALLDLLRVDASDRLLAVSALDFDLSVFDLFGGLGAGASLVLPARNRRAMPLPGRRLSSGMR